MIYFYLSPDGNYEELWTVHSHPPVVTRIYFHSKIGDVTAAMFRDYWAKISPIINYPWHVDNLVKNILNGYELPLTNIFN